MNGNAFDFGEQLHSEKIEYILSIKLRQRFNIPEGIDLDLRQWTSIKYLNNNGNDLNAEVNIIPNNTGGLYLFYMPCSILPQLTSFPLYIGRAQKTKNQNLRKRIKEYFQHYSNGIERPKIYRMLRKWGIALNVAYLALDDNNNTIELERQLINSLLLPMNDQIPDKKIREAVKAFE